VILGTFASNYLRQVGLSEIRVKHLTTHEIDVASQLVEIVLVSVRHGNRHGLTLQITKCQNSTSPVCIAYDGPASWIQLLEFRIDPADSTYKGALCWSEAVGASGNRIDDGR